MEYMVGSPEWFHENSKSYEMIEFRNKTEELRAAFNLKFAPDKLKEMDGKQLLVAMFGDDDTMINLLMYDSVYRRFGAPGEYKYLGIVYYSETDGSWRYKEGSHAESITEVQAEAKAEEIRDQLLECITIIKESELNSAQDYAVLDDALSHVFFYKYPWVLKYYQMVLPQFFPGMYADNTIDRALAILGLPNHGKTKRIVNAGEISLFIRRCDVNNIVFGHIYGGYWGWGDKKTICPSAANNFDNRHKTPHRINLEYYNLPENDGSGAETEKLIKELDENIESLHLEGKEKQALIKIRVNQGAFRKRLLSKYSKCCLCGVSDENFLIASHIKPWAVSGANEKLDQNNGFLLCPNHDQLFDQGYISFDGNGKIIISDSLKESDRVFLNVTDTMHISLTEKNREYLEYHRKNVFKG